MDRSYADAASLRRAPSQDTNAQPWLCAAQQGSHSPSFDACSYVPAVADVSSADAPASSWLDAQSEVEAHTPCAQRLFTVPLLRPLPIHASLPPADAYAARRAPPPTLFRDSASEAMRPPDRSKMHLAPASVPVPPCAFHRSLPQKRPFVTANSITPAVRINSASGSGAAPVPGIAAATVTEPDAGGANSVSDNCWTTHATPSPLRRLVLPFCTFPGATSRDSASSSNSVEGDAAGKVSDGLLLLLLAFSAASPHFFRHFLSALQLFLASDPALHYSNVSHGLLLSLLELPAIPAAFITGAWSSHMSINGSTVQSSRESGGERRSCSRASLSELPFLSHAVVPFLKDQEPLTSPLLRRESVTSSNSSSSCSNTHSSSRSSRNSYSRISGHPCRRSSASIMAWNTHGRRDGTSGSNTNTVNDSVKDSGTSYTETQRDGLVGARSAERDRQSVSCNTAEQRVTLHATAPFQLVIASFVCWAGQLLFAVSLVLFSSFAAAAVAVTIAGAGGGAVVVLQRAALVTLFPQRPAAAIAMSVACSATAKALGRVSPAAAAAAFSALDYVHGKNSKHISRSGGESSRDANVSTEQQHERAFQEHQQQQQMHTEGIATTEEQLHQVSGLPTVGEYRVLLLGATLVCGISVAAACYAAVLLRRAQTTAAQRLLREEEQQTAPIEASTDEVEEEDDQGRILAATATTTRSSFRLKEDSYLQDDVGTTAPENVSAIQSTTANIEREDQKAMAEGDADTQRPTESGVAAVPDTGHAGRSYVDELQSPESAASSMWTSSSSSDEKRGAILRRRDDEVDSAGTFAFSSPSHPPATASSRGVRLPIMATLQHTSVHEKISTKLPQWQCPAHVCNAGRQQQQQVRKAVQEDASVKDYGSQQQEKQEKQELQMEHENTEKQRENIDAHCQQKEKKAEQHLQMIPNQRTEEEEEEEKKNVKQQLQMFTTVLQEEVYGECDERMRRKPKDEEQHKGHKDITQQCAGMNESKRSTCQMHERLPSDVKEKYTAATNWYRSKKINKSSRRESLMPTQQCFSPLHNENTTDDRNRSSLTTGKSRLDRKMQMNVHFYRDHCSVSQRTGERRRQDCAHVTKIMHHRRSSNSEERTRNTIGTDKCRGNIGISICQIGSSSSSNCNCSNAARETDTDKGSVQRDVQMYGTDEWVLQQRNTPLRSLHNMRRGWLRSPWNYALLTRRQQRDKRKNSSRESTVRFAGKEESLGSSFWMLVTLHALTVATGHCFLSFAAGIFHRVYRTTFLHAAVFVAVITVTTLVVLPAVAYLVDRCGGSLAVVGVGLLLMWLVFCGTIALHRAQESSGATILTPTTKLLEKNGFSDPSIHATDPSATTLSLSADIRSAALAGRPPAAVNYSSAFPSSSLSEPVSQQRNVAANSYLTRVMISTSNVATQEDHSGSSKPYTVYPILMSRELATGELLPRKDCLPGSDSRRRNALSGASGTTASAAAENISQAHSKGKRQPPGTNRSAAVAKRTALLKYETFTKSPATDKNAVTATTTSSTIPTTTTTTTSAAGSRLRTASDSSSPPALGLVPMNLFDTKGMAQTTYGSTEIGFNGEEPASSRQTIRIDTTAKSPCVSRSRSLTKQPSGKTSSKYNVERPEEEQRENRISTEKRSRPLISSGGRTNRTVSFPSDTLQWGREQIARSSAGRLGTDSLLRDKERATRSPERAEEQREERYWALLAAVVFGVTEAVVPTVQMALVAQPYIETARYLGNFGVYGGGVMYVTTTFSVRKEEMYPLAFGIIEVVKCGAVAILDGVFGFVVDRRGGSYVAGLWFLCFLTVLAVVPLALLMKREAEEAKKLCAVQRRSSLPLLPFSD